MPVYLHTGSHPSRNNCCVLPRGLEECCSELFSELFFFCMIALGLTDYFSYYNHFKDSITLIKNMLYCHYALSDFSLHRSLGQEVTKDGVAHQEIIEAMHPTPLVPLGLSTHKGSVCSSGHLVPFRVGFGGVRRA